MYPEDGSNATSPGGRWWRCRTGCETASVSGSVSVFCFGVCSGSLTTTVFRVSYHSTCLLFIIYSLRCTALQSDLSGVLELRGRLEGSRPRPPAGVFPELAHRLEAPDTAELLPEAAQLTLRVLRPILRVLIEHTETVHWPGSAAGPVGSEDRCGAEGTVSGGLNRSARTSR